MWEIVFNDNNKKDVRLQSVEGRMKSAGAWGTGADVPTFNRNHEIAITDADDDGAEE